MINHRGRNSVAFPPLSKAIAAPIAKDSRTRIYVHTAIVKKENDSQNRQAKSFWTLIGVKRISRGSRGRRKS